MEMEGDFAWSMLKSYLWGFTGSTLGLKLAKKYISESFRIQFSKVLSFFKRSYDT